MYPVHIETYSTTSIKYFHSIRACIQYSPLLFSAISSQISDLVDASKEERNKKTARPYSPSFSLLLFFLSLSCSFLSPLGALRSGNPIWNSKISRNLLSGRSGTKNGPKKEREQKDSTMKKSRA